MTEIDINANASISGQILQPVLDTFNALDISELPSKVVDQYKKVRDDIANSLGVSGGDVENIGMALGGSIFNAISDKNPAEVAQALQSSLMVIMSAAGGPVGAATAAATGVIESILTAVGGSAHGGGGACENCWKNGEVWYGGFDIAHVKPPASPTRQDGSPDPRWIKWTNQVTNTPIAAVYSDGSYVICGDDLPTNDKPYNLSKWKGSVNKVNNAPNTGHVSTCGAQVSGNFAWVPKALTTFPKDGFDYALLRTLVQSLELYLNGAGPQPSYQFIVGGPQMNLRDMTEKLLVGWNALHQKGKVISINGSDRWGTKSVTFANQTTQQKYILPPNPKKPGSVAALFILSDNRIQSETLYLNTGPLLQSLQDLYDMKNGSLKGIKPLRMKPPAKKPKPVKLPPIRINTLNPHVEAKAVANPSIPYIGMTGGAAVGAFLGGPIGAIVGAGLGAVIEYFERNRTK